jgi:hypothetical protein
MHALARLGRPGADASQDPLAALTPRVKTPAVAAALSQRHGCGTDDDADELIEMRYQEHRARGELQSLFEEGRLAVGSR